jgi:hypothetical protein
MYLKSDRFLKPSCFGTSLANYSGSLFTAPNSDAPSSPTLRFPPVISEFGYKYVSALQSFETAWHELTEMSSRTSMLRENRLLGCSADANTVYDH